MLTPRNAKPAALQPELTAAIAGVETCRTYSFELLNRGASIGLITPNARRSSLSRICQYLPNVAWQSVAVPDVKLGWVPFAIKAGTEMMRDRAFDAIYVSGKPFSSYLIAQHLGRRFGVPWVMDVRDLWALNRRTPEFNAWHAWANPRLERRCVREASAVIVNTPGNRREFVDAYPDCAQKFVTITNGYDSDEFRGLAPDRPDVFTIGYTGTFYFNRSSRPPGEIFATHSPEFLFEALRRLLENDPAMRRRCQVVIAGPKCEPAGEMARRYGLSDVVRLLGWVSHERSLELQRASHLLLLVLARGQESKSWVPAKLYQYLGSGTPILGLIPGGDAAQILRESGAGTVVAPDDVEQIGRVLREAYDRHRAGITPPTADAQVVQRYEAGVLTRRLVEVLNDVAGKVRAERRQTA